MINTTALYLWLSVCGGGIFMWAYPKMGNGVSFAVGFFLTLIIIFLLDSIYSALEENIMNHNSYTVMHVSEQVYQLLENQKIPIHDRGMKPKLAHVSVWTDKDNSSIHVKASTAALYFRLKGLISKENFSWHCNDNEWTITVTGIIKSQ